MSATRVTVNAAMARFGGGYGGVYVTSVWVYTSSKAIMIERFEFGTHCQPFSYGI